jgi:hypothetical protein
VEDELGQLAVPRKGWENEHLAAFLLSRISFVAHPATVADDIGSDFLCTLFEITSGQREMLLPRNSFAIQVKSSKENVHAANKVDYLNSLELPFFLGVVDQGNFRLSIYSGEYLPILFAQFAVRGLRFSLEDAPVVYPDYCSSDDADVYTLKMPFVTDLDSQDTRESLLEKGELLHQLSLRIQANISSRATHEYVFKLDQAGAAIILAGPGSAATFRINFQLRLAEVFYNLEWIHRNSKGQFDLEEYELFARFYNDLVKSSRPILEAVKTAYHGPEAAGSQYCALAGS